jgi:hypothetical protein
VITLSVSMVVLLDRAEIAAARAAAVYDETVSEGPASPAGIVMRAERARWPQEIPVIP